MSRYAGLTLHDLDEQLATAAAAVIRDQAEIHDIEQRIKPLQELRSAAHRSLSTNRDRVSALRAEIERRRAPRPEPSVTDHAVLRYIERKHGIAVDELRSLILSDTVRMALERNASSVTSDGLVFALKNNSVITVMPQHWGADRKRAGRLTRAQRERLEEGEDWDDAIPDRDGETCAEAC